MKTVVTKGEFARMKGRSPAAISNWLADGKITMAALVGSGNRAKIWVEQAERDLAASLDLGQQLCQSQPAVTEGPLASPTQQPGEDFVTRERRARAIRAEEEAKAAQLRNERETGRWIEAHAAQQAWGRELAKILSDLDGFLTGPLARSLAEAHGLEFKALAVEIRSIYRKHRTEVAEVAGAALQAVKSRERLQRRPNE